MFDVRLIRAVFLIALLSVGTNLFAQEPTRQSLESKKQRLSTLEKTLSENQKKSVEIEAQIKALAELQLQLQGLQKSIEEIGDEVSELQEDIPDEEDYLTFIESPPGTVVAVTDADTYLIDFGGTKRTVKLHGLYVEPSRSAQIAKEFKKRLVKRSVYVRCANAGCSQVYIYGDKRGPSLNVELVQAGLARAAGDAKYDVASFLKGSTSATSNTASLSYRSSRSTPGTDVHVGGYYRKDGTYVRPHTRSAPGTKSSGSKSGSSRSSGSRRR